MKILTTITDRITGLLTAPLAELGSWARLARGQIHLWRFCVRRLVANNVMAMSSALSFRTIFALIPSLVVAFLVIKAAGFVDQGKIWLQEFLDQSGIAQITYSTPDGTSVPDPVLGQVEGDITVGEKVEDLVTNLEGQLTVGRLGPVSVVLLIWTAITLLTTIERCLNRIFDATRQRSLARRILTYWTALTLGPLVVIAGAQLGGRLVESVREWPVLSWTLGVAGWVVPILIGIVVLGSLYTFMPNTQVAFRDAMKGAALAVPMWLLVKWGFSVYLDHVAGKSLYGALGLVPLFLMWLNISWWIFLFGAQVVHSAANLERMLQEEADGRTTLTQWHYLAAALAVARGQTDQGGPVDAPQIVDSLRVSPRAVERLLDVLTGSGILVRVAGTGPTRCVLGVPAERLPVSRVLRADGHQTTDPGDSDGDPHISDTVADIRRRTEAGIQDLTLADLIASRPADGDAAAEGER